VLRLLPLPRVVWRAKAEDSLPNAARMLWDRAQHAAGDALAAAIS